ncbi:MAG: alpha/beta fold hydrolase [Cyclobacteriaceae bacterium]|nr:alpha/beta fold hydrolase [Cyclobacteriaceae bacterium]
MKLFYRQSGQGEPLIILHGLFGSSDNWYTLAKTFAEQFTVYLIDQRNHGQSPHSQEFDYKLLAEDLLEFINEHNLKKVNIIGHSMGGKAAMNFAVKYPERVKKLIVVDIVPKAYPVHHDNILEGLLSIDLSHLSSRTEADDLLSKYLPELDVRQFLLKNLYRTSDGGFGWRPNLKAIDDHIKEIGEGMQYDGQYEGPTLFIVGARSTYFKMGDENLLQQVFPAYKLVTLDSGHWVQAEKPKEFAETVIPFLVK